MTNLDPHNGPLSLKTTQTRSKKPLKWSPNGQLAVFAFLLVLLWAENLRIELRARSKAQVFRARVDSHQTADRTRPEEAETGKRFLANLRAAALNSASRPSNQKRRRTPLCPNKAAKSTLIT